MILELMIRHRFVFEMLCGMNEFDHLVLILHSLRSSEKSLKNSGLNVDLNPNLCDAGEVLHQSN